MAYIGSLAYMIVDTERHQGETTYSVKGLNYHSGSDIWYATVGTFVSVTFLCLGGILLPDYYPHCNWWMGLAMSMMLFVEDEYRFLLYYISFALITLGAFAKNNTLQKYLTIGTIYLILAVNMDDSRHRLPQDWFWPPGTWLELVSLGLIAIGMTCHGSTFQTAVATVGICLARVHLEALNGSWVGINLFLRLALEFTVATICISGKIIPTKALLPPTAQWGCSVVLVAATIVLLLITIVVGNSRQYDEWKEIMDFDINRKWYDWDLVDG